MASWIVVNTGPGNGLSLVGHRAITWSKCWLISNWTLIFQWDFNQNRTIFFHENTNENHVWKQALHAVWHYRIIIMFESNGHIKCLRYIASSVYLRLSPSSQLLFMQHMGLRVFRLPIFVLIIVKILYFSLLSSPNRKYESLAFV